jgi:hypothetical protein
MQLEMNYVQMWNGEKMSQGKALVGISRTTFIVGLITAILASSFLSTVVSMLLVKAEK